PCQNLKSELVLDGLQNVATRPLIHPSWMAKIPRLQMSVLQPPVCHLPDCPISSGFVVRRSRQPRAANSSQKMHGMHDLGVVSLFSADLLINVRIGCRLGLSSR